LGVASRTSQESSLVSDLVPLVLSASQVKVGRVVSCLVDFTSEEGLALRSVESSKSMMQNRPARSS